MELKIFWTDFARKVLQQIFDYHKEHAGVNTARKLTSGIVKATLNLRKQPEIGQREELVLHPEMQFRYIIYKNYKIIYRIVSSEESILILDVFNTRQNPVKIKRSVD